MSQARDKFYEILCNSIVKEGYQFKKSKGDFEKVNCGIKYSIQFSWDGRGGTTYLNGFTGLVSLHELGKITKKLLAYELPMYIAQPRVTNNQKYPFIQMSSRKLIELANNMKFKEMAALPFEEKYPIANIQKMAEVTESYIKNEIIPFHNSFIDEKQILDEYIVHAEKKYIEQDFHNISFFVFPIKLMCKKLGIEEPDFIKKIDLFTNKSIDDLWNMQNHDFENLEEKFNNIKFK